MSLEPSIHAFVQRRANGWPTTMHVVRLPSEALVIHSPTWIDDATYDAIDALGTPRVIVVPNHFHHLSLARYRARYPAARVVAAAGALPRLRRKGHEGLLDVVSYGLPGGLRALVPEATRSGEMWLSVEGERGPTWLVCDAFFNETKHLRGLEGALLRLGKIAPGLSIGATFTMLCLRDTRRYAAWVQDIVGREAPQRVLFSHGDPLELDAAAALLRVAAARLGVVADAAPETGARRSP